jgi:peptide/nickel transport system substrate-binding protein
MNSFKMPLAAALLTATALTGFAAPAAAQTMLQLDEVAVGELDPAKATDYADSILMFNIYDTLVLPNQGEPGVQPHLAESWEMEGNDYIFTLRDDVQFQSGNPLTAEDVVFSLDRMKTLNQGLSHLFTKVDSAEAIDERTVRFHLTEPYSPFLTALLRLPIVDKQLVMENLGEGEGEMGDWGQAFLSSNSAGTGAYKVISHNPQSETEMQINENYFLDIAESAPDTVRFRYGLEPATVRTLISQGEHDISSQWLPPEVLRALANSGAQLLTESGASGFYAKMNTQKPPLDDVNCRMALSKAFDYAAGVRLVAITNEVSQGSPSTGAIPVGMLGSNPASEVLTRDLEAARQHLAECKYDPSEFTLQISWIGEVPIEERFALLMQANFAEIGIKSEITQVPWALFTEQVTTPENTPHISQVFVNAVTGDPDTLLYSMYHSSNAGTWQSTEHLKDAKVDELLEKGRTVTGEERAEVYAQLNDRLMELAPSIYINDQVAVFAADPDIAVPALSDPSQSFALPQMGFTFRLMEMPEQE